VSKPVDPSYFGRPSQNISQAVSFDSLPYLSLTQLGFKQDSVAAFYRNFRRSLARLFAGPGLFDLDTARYILVASDLHSASTLLQVAADLVPFLFGSVDRRDLLTYFTRCAPLRWPRPSPSPLRSPERRSACHRNL
jgi:hypothetical protein